jgi:hypothetical protein
MVVKNLKISMRELMELDPDKTVNEEFKCNPLIKRYPILKMEKKYQNKRKNVKSNFISVVNDYNPISEIKSYIKNENEFLNKLLNNDSIGSNIVSHKCSLCFHEIQIGVDPITKCEITTCSQITHIHCSLFDKYLEIRTVRIEDDLNYDIPIIRFNNCIFDEMRNIQFDQTKIKMKNDFNKNKVLDLLGGLMCVKFHDSINSFEILKKKIVEIINVTFEDDFKLRKSLENKIEKWFLSNQMVQEFRNPSMIDQTVFNKLIELIIKESKLIDFENLKAFLKLDSINKHYKPFYVNLIEEKKTVASKSNKMNLKSKKKSNPSKSKKLKFNKPEIKKKSKFIEIKKYSELDLKYSYFFELNKNFNQDLYFLLNLNRNISLKGMAQDHQDLLFPYQKGLYDRVRSFIIFEDYLENENINPTVQPNTPIFKGLCTKHFNR